MLDLGLTFTKQDALFDAQDIRLPFALGSDPGDGVHVTDHVIAYVQGPDVKVYDRVCNHNGGRLISLGGRTICPLHGWELDPATGRYLNADCAKTPIYAGPLAAMPDHVTDRRLSRRLAGFEGRQQVTVRYINHACLIFQTPTITFATDPWVVGSAFCNGWWLAAPSPADAFDALNACDFIYISHNHPDHLHPATLAQIDKAMPIVTADFATGSTVRYLRALGFTNIHACGFDETYINAEAEIAFSVLKSGDFRDDSGLLVEIGAFSALLAVDSNFLDFWRFPDGITLYASSFAGGASGFPLCFDTLDDARKAQLVQRNTTSVKQINRQILSQIKPAVFVPYAGFFSEKAARDADIKARNIKNTVADYAGMCATQGITLVDVTAQDQLTFDGAALVGTTHLGKPPLREIAPEAQIALDTAQTVTLSDDAIATYFVQSGFQKPLDLDLRLTSDDFATTTARYGVQFSADAAPWMVSLSDGDMPRRAGVNYLQICVRHAEFHKVAAQGLPWEDLSIGFQCRIWREPDVYNSDFWYHFSNVYVNDKVAKTATPQCLACDVILQKLSAG